MFAIAFVLLAKPDLAKLHRIVTMGDSITDMGRAPKGYVTLLAQTLNQGRANDPVQVVNVGIGGQKSYDMLARFGKDVVDRHPDLVTISVGVNDVWHAFKDFAHNQRHLEGNLPAGNPLPKYLDEVQKMVRMAKLAGAQVVLLSPTLIYEDLDSAENKRVQEYVRAEEGLARRERVGFVNLYKPFHDTVAAYQKVAGKRQLLLTMDGVHPNDAGNALIADVILKYLGAPVPNGVAAK